MQESFYTRLTLPEENAERFRKAGLRISKLHSLDLLLHRENTLIAQVLMREIPILGSQYPAWFIQHVIAPTPYGSERFYYSVIASHLTNFLSKYLPIPQIGITNTLDSLTRRVLKETHWQLYRDRENSEWLYFNGGLEQIHKVVEAVMLPQ